MSEEARIQQMKEEILANAKAEAKKALSEAKKQSEELLRKGREAAEKEKLKIIETQTKTITELEKQQIAAIHLQARREILQTKEEGIKKAFSLAQEELKKFPQKAGYSKVLQALIIEAAVAIGGGKLIIKARKEDKPLLKDLTKLAKEISKESGNSCTLKLAKEPIDSIGGIVLFTEDESITINNTFEARLEENYRAIRAEVAKVLFD